MFCEGRKRRRRHNRYVCKVILLFHYIEWHYRCMQQLTYMQKIAAAVAPLVLVLWRGSTLFFLCLFIQRIRARSSEIFVDRCFSSLYIYTVHIKKKINVEWKSRKSICLNSTITLYYIVTLPKWGECVDYSSVYMRRGKTLQFCLESRALEHLCIITCFFLAFSSNYCIWMCIFFIYVNIKKY